MTEKNVELLHDTLAFGELLATKHANGKDWWIVTPRRNSNTFYVLKFTKDGIVDTLRQTIGIKPKPAGEGYGQIVFSPDGSKVYRTNPFNPVMVYDFDREAGVFTHFDTISFKYGNQPVIGEIGCAVSPNGRFLYLSCRRLLYQLDLWASDISASQLVVAEWDGFADPLPTMFWQCQLGPDCKIYIRAGGDTRYFHVIHYPDEPGLACQVEQRGLPLPTPSGASMPSFPNYRLGPVDNPGLPCSPVVSVGAPPSGEVGVWVYPNPVRTTLKILAGRRCAGPVRLRLFDLAGRPVLERVFDPLEAVTEIDVRELATGVYFYALWSEGTMQGVGKVMKIE
ncbi:MAG: T9SS type A sorting domain-containing protein [Saprospirales bacterium]|nr:T9SS type A sorting domain-containing protein [Saprospirales bacterium]